MARVTIARLGHQGDGLADGLDGPIIAPLTLPGDVIEGNVENGRIDAFAITTPSPHRVDAKCPRFGSCGGCALQHAADGFVAEWKRAQVVSALEAQGISGEILAPVTSAPNARRRATLAARRTRKGAVVGFHGRASGTMTDINGCTLLHPDIMASLPMLERLTKIGASRKGEIGLGATVSERGLDIDVKNARATDQGILTELGEIAHAHGIARLSWNGEVVLVLAEPEQSFDGLTVVPPPGAFLQATKSGERTLQSSVGAFLGGAAAVVDLFSGCGTFALPLARQARVLALEGDAGLVRALEKTARVAKGLKPLKAATRDLFRNPLDGAELDLFDAAVIDPPRAGAKAQISALCQSKIARIASVSCNPSTFARDARMLLDAGFTMGPVQVVDQFLWSTHVELFAGFTR